MRFRGRDAALTTPDKSPLSLERSHPFGDDAWTMKLANQLGLEHTIRREGRPKLEKADVEAKY